MQMALLKTLWVLVSIISCAASVAFADEIPATVVEVPPFNRSSFGPGFIFGTASSAYQYEGGREGRGQHIWDTFASIPGKILDGSNGDVAVDQFHRYKEDVRIMKYMKVDAYRFSLAWSRILPTGRRSGGINYGDDGVGYYKKLIRELKDNDIEPYVTIFHWDLPQALEDEYGGFLNKTIVDDFRDYADVCFELFGEDVKHWITINEPSIFTKMGYVYGNFAPGRCSASLRPDCTGGDSSTEPYIVSHNMLLAHAAAYRLYQEKYLAADKGKVGITLSQGWVIPYSNSTQDQDAAKRALDFEFGWYMEPLTRGDYPRSMRLRIGSRLPVFNSTESDLVKGSFNFIGLNYYTSNYASHSDTPGGDFLTDSGVNVTFEREGVPLGPKAGSGNGWIYIYPQGLRDILLHIKEKYGDPYVFITENGMDEVNDPSLPVEEAVLDTYRIDYYYRHLYYLRSAIEKGANVHGYFAWSLLDNFEWSSGYTSRFGINFVDYNDDLKRYHKLSATWFRNFLDKNKLN